MTDQSASGPEEHSAAEEIGTVTEEAARLLGALADLVSTNEAGWRDSADRVGQRVTAAAREIDEHLATDDQDCRYCPVCRALHAVRGCSPEVRAHLATAGLALAQAAALLLDPAQDQPSEEPVERIPVQDQTEDPLDW